jgi:beta-mannosidase
VDLNERVVQWVGEKTWLYRTYFKAPVKRDQRTCTTDLVFDGLDTFATVFLNGTKILKTNNMFVAYRTNVTNHLKDESQDNLLEIVFDSALLRGRELVNEHAHEHNFLVRQTESGRLATRKAQYNWGWDWGPILMTAGPWKPVYIEQYEARISDVWIQNEVSLDLRECSGTVYAELDGGLQPGDTLLLSLSKDCKRVYEEEVSVGTDGCPRELLEKPFRLSQPELWYPLGYGAQARYELRAKLVRDGRELSYQSKMIGFRRTELVQEPDAHGKSFYFRINNIDIFSGGSCWIPTDSFLSQISAKRYRDWIALMVESNQVMIRIWGGGVYEDDALLDACDELGVMIWHDFQFACGSYPTYESFLKNFETEARQQIRRLRSHPSMVIWAGNNEDYQVQERYKLEYNYDEDKDPESWLKSTFPARYLYEYLVPKLVQEEDRHTIYHPSSPWGDGKPTADPSVGDIHQWNRKRTKSPYLSQHTDR